MDIIRGDRPVIVSARAEAIHVGQVHVGQEAKLRFSAFDRRPTPDVTGRVISVSADVLRDAIGGVARSRLDLGPPDREPPLPQGSDPVPGRPVEAFIRTEGRTPPSLPTRSLTDRFGRACRHS